MGMRIGFVGTGQIARGHAALLRQMEGVEVVGFCGTDPSRTSLVSRMFGATAYETAEEMLDRARLDAMYICIPPFAHGQAELAATERKVPIFIEKPVGISKERATEIASAIDRSGIICSVGYHWRYLEQTDRASALLDGRDCRLALGYYMGPMPAAPWWRVQEMSGGQMVEQTTHIVDLARYLLGEVVQVYAGYTPRTAPACPGADVNDGGAAILTLDNGAIVNVSNCCFLNQSYRTGLHLFTADMIIEIGDGLRILEGHQTTEIRSNTNAFVREDQAFIEAIRTENRSLIRCNHTDAVQTLAVTLACNQSAATTRPVRIGLEPEGGSGSSWPLTCHMDADWGVASRMQPKAP